MNKTEYLADLATKVVAFKDPINKAGPIVTSPPNPSQSNQAIVAAVEAGANGLGTITSWVAPVITIGPIGVYNELQVRFRVMNLGVVAGPQVYAQDVTETDEETEEVTVVHAAGDPILDDEGNPVVYPDEYAERVLPETVIENPLGDVIDAVAYWETLKADPASPIIEYREIKGEDKRSDLGFYTMKAWVQEGDNVREAVFLTNRDSEGNPQHIEIV